MTPADLQAAMLACTDSRLNAALQYVLKTPGKQLRARLVDASFQMFSQRPCAAVVSVATAIEWLHTYSLVHDDLPAMDNDPLRRGKPTVHTVYDDATAILVGDGLQAAAFGLISRECGLSAEIRIKLLAVVTEAVGFAGMVGGQALDMAAEGASLTIEELGQIHRQKTGALIRAAILSGALCADAEDTDIAHLDRFAGAIGLAFQVADDILDVTQSSSTLGKTAGKDLAVEKCTYVRHLGLEGAQAEAERLLAEALDSLSRYGDRAAALADLAVAMVRRET